jgi:hypothetical protein
MLLCRRFLQTGGWPTTLPDRTPRLAKLVDRPPAQVGWGHEIKFDGYRTQLRVKSHRAELRTRKGFAHWIRLFGGCHEPRQPDYAA